MGPSVTGTLFQTFPWGQYSECDQAAWGGGEFQLITGELPIFHYLLFFQGRLIKFNA